MIKSFKNKGLQIFFEDGCTSGINAQHQPQLSKYLTVLNAATSIGDFRTAPKSWGLHPLKGELAGYWSFTVKQNWRLIFKFEGTDVILVDYLDYH